MTYVQIHTHSEHSALDGLSTASEIADVVAAQGAPAAAITDHGMCSGHPEWQRACDSAGIKPIFGIEAYFVPERTERPGPGDTEGQKRLRSNKHLVLLAMDDQGLRDLWALSTEAFVSGHYWKPRVDWELLERYGSHLIATTACLGGVVAEGLLGDRDQQDRALRDLLRLHGIFGDRLYLEVQSNLLPNQLKLNAILGKIAQAKGELRLVAAADAHFPAAEQEQLHKLWLACRAGQANEDYWHFEHMHDEELTWRNLARSLHDDAIGQAISSTMEIAERCNARISGHAEPPVLGPAPEADARELLDRCLAAWPHTPKHAASEREYLARLEDEWRLVASKGLAGCYLIVHDVIRWARSEGILSGPGRGSAASSVMSYLLGITKIDPIEHGLIFARFLTPGRVALPDFDMDFPSSARQKIQDHVIGTYGAGKVVRVGTHLRYRSRGVLQKLFPIMAGERADNFADSRKVSAIIDEAEVSTAGLGLSWEQLMDQAGDQLAPYVEKYPEVFEAAAGLTGRLHAFGRHPAGLVISTSASLAGSLPMRIAEDNDTLISQFDFRDMEALGLLKLDFLTIRTLDTVSYAIDLIRDRAGQVVNPPAWSAEYRDPQVWDAVCTGHTLGMFQIETALGAQSCRSMRPRSVKDLAAINALVRPGPRNSGISAAYTRRRRGDEPPDPPHPRLQEALSSTYGLMVYQEDILATCRILAGYDDAEADEVRKILGKKLVEKAEAAGEKFVARCQENGVTEDDAKAIWELMAEHARYCLSGDSKIDLASTGKYASLTVEQMWRRIRAPLREPEKGGWGNASSFDGPCVACGSHDPGTGWTRGLCSPCCQWRKKFLAESRGVYALSYFADGRIRPARILDILAQGEQDTWKITLADGRSITATGGHRHLTDKGYRRVSELAAGDQLIADAGYERQVYEPEKQRLTRGDRQQQGTVNGAFGQENYGFIDGGGVAWKAWKASHPKVCAQCGQTEGRIECAHLDGDHSNNNWVNLAWLCVSCHKAYDYANNSRRRRWQKGHLSTPVSIVSIEYAGCQETYDVVMDAPHNFLVDGIVTHNSFNRAHAASYAALGYWTAWLKAHYPVETFTAILSTLGDKDRLAAFVTDARRLGCEVLPPDVNKVASGFQPEGLGIRYGLDAVKGVGPKAVASIARGQPYRDYDDFAARSQADSGVIYALAQAGALDPLVASRRGLVMLLEADRSGESVTCIHKDETTQGPNGLPCTYDWPSEPVPVRIGKRGQELPSRQKPLPKRCTRACRHYTPPPLRDISAVPEYDPGMLWRMEQEIYGTWLTPALFARLDQLAPGLRSQVRELAEILPTAAPGKYPLAAVLAGVRTARTRSGKLMAWARLATEAGNFDLAVFQPRDDGDPDLIPVLMSMQAGTLVQAEAEKTRYFRDRQWRISWRLLAVAPLSYR